jgi:hypothetical protein
LHIDKLLEQYSGWIIVVSIKKRRTNNGDQFLTQHDLRLLGIKNTAARSLGGQTDDEAQINGFIAKQDTIPVQHFLAQGNGIKGTTTVFAAILPGKHANPQTKPPDQKIRYCQFAFCRL